MVIYTPLHIRFRQLLQYVMILLGPCMVVTSTVLANSGFVAGTMVKVPNGYQSIEQIKKGDTVIAYGDGHYVERQVVDTVKNHTPYCYHLSIGDEIIGMASNQKLYLFESDSWIEVYRITDNQLISTNQGLLSINRVVRINQLVEVFDLTVADDHNFCATPYDIVVHNFLSVVVGLSWLIGAGVVEFAGFSLATVMAGIAAGVIIHNKGGKKDIEFKLGEQTDSIERGNNGGSEDPEDKRKKNEISKSEFFHRKEIKKDYEYCNNGTYKRKPGAKGIDNAEYLKWDHLHNDVEAYTRTEKHLGSIDPKTLKFYKEAVRNRTL